MPLVSYHWQDIFAVSKKFVGFLYLISSTIFLAFLNPFLSDTSISTLVCFLVSDAFVFELPSTAFVKFLAPPVSSTSSPLKNILLKPYFFESSLALLV